MPIPAPRAKETKSQFIGRCMNDPVMKKEYPNETQRSAVCNAAWDKKHSALANLLRARGFTPCQIAIEIARAEQEQN